MFCQVEPSGLLQKSVVFKSGAPILAAIATDSFGSTVYYFGDGSATGKVEMRKKLPEAQVTLCYLPSQFMQPEVDLSATFVCGPEVVCPDWKIGKSVQLMPLRGGE